MQVGVTNHGINAGDVEALDNIVACWKGSGYKTVTPSLEYVISVYNI